ncbi:MAG TPA: oligosaccharide flippase family protein [Pseudonocardiaceae bacterium]|nr:oligosaccharide flippase family protein [Pseudonocardiaceae bacterium]
MRPVDLRHRRRLVVLSGSSALQAAAGAVAALVATQSLGPKERGLMVLGLTIGSLYGLVGGLGCGPAFRSRLPAARLPSTRRHLVSSFTWCSLAGGCLAVVAAVLTTAVSAAWIDPDLRSGPFLVATASYTVAQVMLGVVPDGWFADGHFRRGGVAAAGMSAGGLVGVGVALFGTHSAATVLNAQAVGIVMVGVIEMSAMRRAGLLSLGRPDLARSAILLRRGLPALGLAVGLAVVLRADRYVLGTTVGTTAVGVYSLAATLAEVSRILPAALGQLFLRDVSVGRPPMARFAPAVRFAIASAVVSGVIVVTGGWLLIVPVFGPQFAPARPLLTLLAVAEVGFAPYAVASRGLLGGGWTRAAGALGVCGGLGGVAVYVVAARIGGAMGTAVGSGLVYASLSIVSCALLRRRVSGTSRNRGSVDR